MHDVDASPPIHVCVGGLRRQELYAALDGLGVRLNDSARALLAHGAFDRPGRDAFDVRQCTVGQLGFARGATMASIVAGAHDVGLTLCPAITGPYLRLVTTDQESAPDAAMSHGFAPPGSITVAAPALDNDQGAPKGFYLRAVAGVLWLRGYHATDDYMWSPNDCFAFREGLVT